MPEVSPVPFEWQLLDNNGAPLSGGLVFTYQIHTLTPLVTYQDIDGLIPNTNPIVCDAAGRLFCWASSDLRIIVKDSNNVLITDFNSTTPLRSDIISDAMLPVVGAPTTAIARTRLGVDAAIQAAINAVQLLPGTPGATGAQGIQGVPGPPGAAGGGYQVNQGGGGPWVFQFPNLNGIAGNFLYLQTGATVSDSSGHGTVTFNQPFAVTCMAVVAMCEGQSTWANVQTFNTNAFSFTTSSPLFGGSWLGGPTGVTWIAIGV